MNLIAPGEGEIIAVLHRSAFPDSWDAAAFETLLASKGVFGFQEEAAGFILCRAAAGEAEILTLAVAPASRRAGLGARLLASAVAWAESIGCEAMFLEVAEDNAAALALYRSAGFERVGRRPAYYSRAGGAVAALVMRRDLNR